MLVPDFESEQAVSSNITATCESKNDRNMILFDFCLFKDCNFLEQVSVIMN